MIKIYVKHLRIFDSIIWRRKSCDLVISAGLQIYRLRLDGVEKFGLSLGTQRLEI